MSTFSFSRATGHFGETVLLASVGLPFISSKDSKHWVKFNFYRHRLPSRTGKFPALSISCPKQPGFKRLIRVENTELGLGWGWGSVVQIGELHLFSLLGETPGQAVWGTLKCRSWLVLFLLNLLLFLLPYPSFPLTPHFLLFLLPLSSFPLTPLPPLPWTWCFYFSLFF